MDEVIKGKRIKKKIIRVMGNKVSTSEVGAPKESCYFFCERHCFLDQEKQRRDDGKNFGCSGLFKFFKYLLI